MSVSASGTAGPLGWLLLEVPIPAPEPGVEVSGTQFCLGDLHTMKECAISITKGPPHCITSVVQSLRTINPRLNQLFVSKINFEKRIIEESRVSKGYLYQASRVLSFCSLAIYLLK